MKVNDRITVEKIDAYYKITSSALALAQAGVVKTKQKAAGQIFLMVSAYLSDALYFKKKGALVDAYGALNYAHGWLDCGARLKIYRVSDSKLFTI